MAALSEIALLPVEQSVCPSGGDLAQASVPMMLSAPMRFSTNTGTPNCFDNGSTRPRERTSLGTPGATAAMMRIGPDGKVCAAAKGLHQQPAQNIRNARFKALSPAVSTCRL